MGTPGRGTNDPSEVYQAVRAHEVMLNEATSALERGVLMPLITLNGGAAAAFLTLLGALDKDARLVSQVDVAGQAILAWAAGLLLAAWQCSAHPSTSPRSTRATG